MSDIKQLRLDYTLEMLDEFHIGSGAGIAGLVDRAVLRLSNGELVVPGSTIKGRVRYRTEQLAHLLGATVCGGRADHGLCRPESPSTAAVDLCLICRLFGSEWWPGTLFCSDARLIDPLRDTVYEQRDLDDSSELDFQTVNRTRTRMNRRFRRVEEGALFTSQHGVAGLSFTGKIEGAVPCAQIEDLPVALEPIALVAALRLVDCVGANKTIGLGRTQVKVTNLTVREQCYGETELDRQISEYLEWVSLYDDYRKQ